MLWFGGSHHNTAAQLTKLPPRAELTAIARGLVRRVAAVTGLVTHLLHADTLPAATLKQGGALTHVHWEEGGEREQEMSFG